MEIHELFCAPYHRLLENIAYNWYILPNYSLRYRHYNHSFFLSEPGSWDSWHCKGDGQLKFSGSHLAPLPIIVYLSV